MTDHDISVPMSPMLERLYDAMKTLTPEDFAAPPKPADVAGYTKLGTAPDWLKAMATVQNRSYEILEYLQTELEGPKAEERREVVMNSMDKESRFNALVGCIIAGELAALHKLDSQVCGGFVIMDDWTYGMYPPQSPYVLMMSGSFGDQFDFFTSETKPN